WIIILLWLLGGLLALAGALVYAEISTTYQLTGGPFNFSEKVFGRQAGFTVGFLDWFFNLASTAALTVAASEYLLNLTGISWPVPVTGMVMIIVLSFTQWFGIKLGDAIQKGLSGIKAVGLLFLVIAFFIHGHASANAAPPVLTLSPIISISALLLAFRSITFTYSGWNSPVYFPEENDQPGRNIPRSLIYGVLLITFLYILVNVSLLYMMPVDRMAHSKIAVADAADLVFGTNAKSIVTALSIIIILSCVYAGILYIPRIIYGMARSGSFFSLVGKLNAYRIPGAALMLSGGVCVTIIFSGTFEFITAISTFLYLFVDTTVYLAALVSRQHNKTGLAFRAPAFPFLHVLMIIINMALLTGIFVEDVKSGLYAVAVIGITVPLYWIFRNG
ncbi:MAG TPA: amino acid permease, partial [Saprospiraceae bacterium]|nr:amino acid permease [Saprospiraceae bacterium]